MFCKKGVLKIFTKCTGNDLYLSLFLMSMQVFSQELYQQRDSGVGVFLWTLQNFLGQLFYRTTPDKLFWKSTGFYFKRSQQLANNISKAKNFYENFHEKTFMKTFNRGSSCSWMFSAFWACRKGAFLHVNCFSFDSCSMLKMFWIISEDFELSQ